MPEAPQLTVDALMSLLPRDGRPMKLVDLSPGRKTGRYLLVATRDAMRAGKIELLMHDDDAAIRRVDVA